MWKTIRKQAAIQGMDWLVLILFIFGGWIFGVILHRIIFMVDSSVDSYFPLGTVMAMMAGGLCCVLMWMFQLGYYFNLEIAMGCTRKHFFISFYAVGFVCTLFYLGIIVLLNLVEQALEKWIYAGFRCEIDILPYLLKWGIPAAAGMSILSGFFGALLLRYGKKAGWLFWGLWMFAALGFPRIGNAVRHAPNSLFGKIGHAFVSAWKGIPVPALLGTAVFLCIVCFAGSWLCLRRQQVKG